jgi:hypothetical protein
MKNLKAFGDSEIIVRWVRNTIHCNSSHLKGYEYEVHNLLNNFSSFNITAIPRSKNREVDSLSIVASRLDPQEDYERRKSPLN